MRKNLLLLFIFLGLNIAFSLPAQAADFSVNDATSLIAAINAANSSAGADVITLTSDISVSDIYNSHIFFGSMGLPYISSDITINGNGFTIERNSPFNIFRLFTIVGGTLTINDATIAWGNAYNTGGLESSGGNIAVITGTLHLFNSSVEQGEAGLGGGIYNLGTATLSNSTISNNVGFTSGAGIYNSGTVTVTDSTLSGNVTFGSGAGIYNSGTVTVTDSTLSGNTAVGSGGGIYNSDTATLSNSTLSGNIAFDFGAGIYNSGTVTVTDSTLSGNTAVGSGGGIYNNNSISLNNSIVAGNTATGSGDECELASGTFTADANNIFGTDNDNGGCTNGASDIVPAAAVLIGDILAPLADNGGPTETHALVAGSLAIDASGAGATSSDQRGAAAFNTRDIGAFEFSGIVPTVTVGTVSAITVLENGGVVTIPVTVTNLAAGDSLTIVANISGGTAINSTDYTITASLSFNADGSQDFVITGLADALIEGDETLIVSFSLIGTADISGNGNQTVTIIDIVVPIFTKAFAPSTIVLAGTSTLSFTIDNTASSVDASALDFTDNLPAGMTIATPANASTTCTGGTLTALDGSATITYTGGMVSALSTCSISVDLEGILVGTHSNLTGDLTSSLGNSGTAAADLIVNSSPGSPASPAQSTLSGEPAIAVFDPAISKLGLLQPGQTGVTGEQLEWIVTVSNVGTVAGTNVTITDTLIPALQIDSVDAPGATVTISGQTVTVTYPTLAIGQTVQFSIFTTVLSGATVSNVACVNADNQLVEECATGLAVSELPSTGEAPFWRYTLLMGIALLLGGTATALLYRKPKTKNQ